MRPLGSSVYDVIRSVSERPVEDGDQLIRTISALSPGARSVFRGSRRQGDDADRTPRREGRVGAVRVRARRRWSRRQCGATPSAS